MRLLWNFVKVVAHLAVATVFGYHSFIYNGQGPWNGQLALITNAAFLIIGVSMVATWTRKERKLSEHFSEALSSGATDTVAGAVAGKGKTGRAGTRT